MSVTLGPLTCSAEDADNLAPLCLAEAGSEDGVLLYGSRARGTAHAQSDIDVLILRDHSPGAWSNGLVNATAYRPAHLKEMARHGSLFVLHLRQDGVILQDPSGALADALAAYRAPRSYENLLAELAAAGGALIEVSDTWGLEKDLLRLGDYLVRTAAYARAAEAGTPEFDPNRIGQVLGDRVVATVISSRGTRRPGQGGLVLLREALERLLGRSVTNQYGSVEALAVMLAGERPFASALLAQLIAGDGVDYSTLTPPPL